jgi:hypothetical protein
MNSTFTPLPLKWQILLFPVAILFVGCASESGSNVAAGLTGAGIGAGKGIITDGKVSLADVVSNTIASTSGSIIANKGAEKRVGEAFDVGKGIGDQETTKETYEIVQRVHKAQEDEGQEKLVTKLYQVPAPQNPNSNVKQVPHDIVILTQEPAR